MTIGQIIFIFLPLLKESLFILGFILLIRSLIPPFSVLLDENDDPNKFVSLYNFEHLKESDQNKVFLMLISSVLLFFLSFLVGHYLIK